jgi:DNA-binding SARP family transcriptional activator/Flp pilus assembly protein TadD
VTDRRGLRFALLGPLLVEHDGEPLRLPRSEVLRGLLGVLLAAEGAALTPEQLVRLVWGGSARDVSAGSVQVAVSRLRKWLATLPGPVAERVGVEHGPSGYRLSTAEADVDLAGFRALVAGADRAADPHLRLKLLREAMRLVRGPLMDDLPALDRDDPLLGRIEADVRQAGLALADVAVDVGEGDVALGWLEHHVGREPLDEPAQARLLAVLAGSGRPAEALATYERLRGRLLDELGVAPSEELQQAYLAVLADDRDVAVPAAAAVRPGLLPPDVADFTGRDDEVGHLLDSCAGSGRPRTAVPVVNIVGRAGVGKTALATRVGHLLTEAYPDGQLYADLRGAEGRPADPADVLARFLRALGRDGTAIPHQVDERVELYRDELARRRVLVVLDSAAGEEQVRPLLPGGPSCAVLITSRRGLTGVSARAVRLEVLDDRAALELLTLVAGRPRVVAEPEAAEEIVRLCGGLPLAIRIAGARLARLPHRSLRWLADRLADDRGRLNELRLEDLEVRASLWLSYRTLSRHAQLLLGRVGALEAPEVPAWVAAVLTETAEPAAEDCLDELVEAHLVDAGARDDLGRTWFHMHDLVRIYARERGDSEDPGPERRAAVLRALASWCVMARAADSLLQHGFPETARCEPVTIRELTGGIPVDTEPCRRDPLAWFEAERPGLVAAVHQAHELGADDLSWDLASRLTGFFEIRSHYDDWRETHHTALRAARRAGAEAAEAGLLNRLGEMHANLDAYEAALEHFAEALEISTRLGDDLGRAHVLRSAGVAQRMVGRADEARESLESALAVFLEHGDTLGIAAAQHGLGAIHREQGRWDAAVDSYREALRLFEAAGDTFTQSMVLSSLGVVLRLTGCPEDASRCFQRSLELSRDLRNRHGEAFALCYLGELKAEQGEVELARSLLEAGREACEDVGERFGLALVWRAFAVLHGTTGDLAASLDCLTRSLGILTDLDLPGWRGRVLEALGDLHARQGRHEAAMACWREAITLLRAAQAAEAEQLAQRTGLD